MSEFRRDTPQYNLTGKVIIHDSKPRFMGNYSFVFQGTLGDKLVAVKVIQGIGESSSVRRKILRERTVWTFLNHQNILPFYGYTKDSMIGQFDTPFGTLISPWCKNGDASKFIGEYGNILSLEDRTALWKGAIDGVAYLHQHRPPIVHGDLKPGNILIDDSGCPRLCDFGLAQIFFDEPGSGMTTTSEHTGTERYLAPELVVEYAESHPTAASDVYAIGCLGLEFIYLREPYSHRKNNLRGVIYTDIRKGVPPATDCDTPSSPVWGLITSCWNNPPESRPSASSLASTLQEAVPNTSDDVTVTDDAAGSKMRYMREEDEARRQEHRKSGTSSINRRSRDPSGKPVQPTGILKKTGTSATFTDRMPSVSPPSPDLVDLIQGPWSESEDDRSDDDELRSNTIYNATKPKYHPDRDGYATPWDRRLWIEGHRPLGRYKKSDSIRGGDGAGRGGGTGGGVIAYVPVLFTILPVNQTTRAILQLFRLFGECQVLISFRRHTEQTLKKLRDVLNRMRMAPLQKPLDLRLNTVKMHVLHTHLVDSIKAKGPAQNTSTSFGEACHPQSKKDCRLTNQQENEFEVTIKIALRRQTIQKIRDRVDGEAETDQVARSTQRIESSIHVVFGSPDPRTTVGQLLQNLQIPEHLPPLDHGRLLTSLKTCLYHNSDVFKTGSMTFNSHTPIIPQKYARIRYVSKHNNELLEDKIRVNRQWYGKGPRYDYILVNLDGESVSCAQLHSMFTLKVNKEDTLQIALIRILKNLSRNATTGFIHASESTEYRFVSTKCFVRSAYVHPPTRDHPRYIVNDFIDPDMYVRLEEQWNIPV